MSATKRDQLVDGYRGVAVLCVWGHAVVYHFRPAGFLGRTVIRFADPFSEMGVQLFFVISGYIITTLLTKEERTTGSISIPAFYIRRFSESCRRCSSITVPSSS